MTWVKSGNETIRIKKRREAIYYWASRRLIAGVMIYPIIRAMFPVRIVGTALTSLNFFVLMGAAVTQQIMGMIIGSFVQSGGEASPQAYHAAFLFPVAALAVAIVLYMLSRDYSDFR